MTSMIIAKGEILLQENIPATELKLGSAFGLSHNAGRQGNPFRNLWDLWYNYIVFEGSRIPRESSRVSEAPRPS